MVNFERRKHSRVDIDAYVSATLTTDRPGSSRMFTTRDISPEGIFLTTREIFPLGTILKLKIHTPLTTEPINAEAKVVRAGGNQSGMGLVFIKISEQDRKELLKHLYLAYHYTREKR
ncbi:MAG: PilZ domain-containing protein [Candidatus Omnitrophica bacterium]|nr:PilZ domain-containing protein [Candidatus Omnitrophota bacterium]MDD5553441.1 PilZ domain-containing protein [Candidatus Omnitrophota bacterium]